MTNLTNGRFLGIGEVSRFLVVCLLQTSAKKVFNQTPGHPTPHITERGVSTVTLGWLGDLNQRVPFRFHDGVVGFAEDYHKSCLLSMGMTTYAAPVLARTTGVLYTLRGAQSKSS